MLHSCCSHVQVEVTGVEGELKQIALAALRTRPNFAYTIGEVRREVWDDVCIRKCVRLGRRNVLG